MKTPSRILILGLLALIAWAAQAQAVDVRHRGGGDGPEANRIRQDYLNIRANLFREHVETGEVAEATRRSFQLTIGFAETKGYRFHPPLRTTRDPNLHGAALIQLLEDPANRFDYPSLYNLNLPRQRPR